MKAVAFQAIQTILQREGKRVDGQLLRLRFLVLVFKKVGSKIVSSVC